MSNILNSKLVRIIVPCLLVLLIGAFYVMYQLFQSEQRLMQQLLTRVEVAEGRSQTAVSPTFHTNHQPAVSSSRTEFIIVPPIATERPSEPAKVLSRSQSSGSRVRISPIFSKEVRYWEGHIVAWGEQYQLDPDLVATIMQIESCGHPHARSSAGALGLFQVMPHHFLPEETAVDPDTNAHRGMSYLNEGLAYHQGDLWRALAGYNAGHGNVRGPIQTWPQETQTYHYWGKGIYEDAKSGLTSSPTLQAWLGARGNSLCWQAARWLDL